MSWNGSTYQFLAEDGYQRAMGSMSKTVNEVASQRDNAMAALKKRDAAYGEVVNELEEARERLNAFADHLRTSTETVISLKTENFNLKEEVEDLKKELEIEIEVKLEVVQERNEQAKTIKEQVATIETLQDQCKVNDREIAASAKTQEIMTNALQKQSEEIEFLKELLEEQGISTEPSGMKP